MGCGFQRLSQGQMIVDFTIEGDDKTSTARHHGLMSCWRQIQNGQAPVSERHAGRSVSPYAVVIRATMLKSGRHPAHDIPQLVWRGAFGTVKKSGKSAHFRSLGVSGGYMKRPLMLLESVAFRPQCFGRVTRTDEQRPQLNTDSPSVPDPCVQVVRVRCCPFQSADPVQWQALIHPAGE